MAESSAVEPLLALVNNRATPRSLLLEALGALGAIGSPKSFDAMLDLFSSPVAPVRLAAMTAASKMDPEGFLLALSSAERDRDWTVRAGLAAVLSSLPPERAMAAVDDWPATGHACRRPRSRASSSLAPRTSTGVCSTP